MADTSTAALCVEIVKLHFGPLTATVASTLIRRGRLTLQQLIKYSSLKPRTARASILVLVQHNLVWHAQADDGSGEVVEFNVDECLLRMRFGRFVWQANELFGSAAGEIISLVLDHGKLRPPDVLSHFAISNPKNTSVYKQALLKLVVGSYLIASTILSHISPRDKFLQYEAEEKKKLKNFPTARELKEAKERAAARLKREQDQAAKVGLTKQLVKDANSRSNKRKHAEEDVVDDEVYFRVNPAKFNVHIRNRLIETAVEERFNSSAAAAMRAALKATESKQTQLSDVRSEPISINNIAMHIPDDVNITTGLVYPSSKKPNTMTALKDIVGLLAAADNPTPEGRASSFLSANNPSKVQVEFEIICRRLRHRVLEAVARERHGDEAVRVIRYLLDTGKMNGDQLAKVVMMANKDIRPLLSALSTDSLVSIQEVPKAADRHPLRTFYLWYVDLPKACANVLGIMYKTLFNVYERRCAEAEDRMLRAVLQKSERTDVQADPSLLSRNERDILSEWETKRDKLSVLEMRVEEAVFILRDLSVVGSDEE